VKEIDFNDLYAEGKWEYVMLSDSGIEEEVVNTENDDYRNQDNDE